MNLPKRFYIIVLFPIFSLLIINCHSYNNLAKNRSVQNDSLKIFEGKIIKVKFVDKGGRVHDDIFSYYFKTGHERLFIKIPEGKISSKEIAKNFDKEIKIKGYKTFGLWDTDDPNVQSRVGDYIVFLKIMK